MNEKDFDKFTGMDTHGKRLRCYPATLAECDNLKADVEGFEKAVGDANSRTHACVLPEFEMTQTRTEPMPGMVFMRWERTDKLRGVELCPTCTRIAIMHYRDAAQRLEDLLAQVEKAQ